MDFGLMFFSSKSDDSRDKYQLLLQATRFADEHDFCFVYTPERHFDVFGGLFPNPSVISAALAMITSKLQLRAGSLISPLHSPIRIVEEWAVVDNLSNGRVGLSFGSGWNVNDFVFFPEHYANRQSVMYQQIETIRKLWQGEPTIQKNSHGHEVALTLHPKPLQPLVPIWVTSAGSTETFQGAGAIGAHILTHLANQDLKALAEKINIYRKARQQNQHAPEDGLVTVMLHAFIADSQKQAEAKVRHPLREYLRSAVLLENAGFMHQGQNGAAQQMPADILEELLDITFTRFVSTSSLIGTLESCTAMVQKLEQIGVDEIACLVDFGVEPADVLQSLEPLNKLRLAFTQAEQARG